MSVVPEIVFNKDIDEQQSEGGEVIESDVEVTPESILTPEQLFEVTEVFKLMDQDNEDFVKADELYRCLRLLGFYIGPDTLHGVKVQHNLESGDDPIDFLLLCKIAATMYSILIPEEEIRAAFQVFDFENTGKISAVDLKKIMGTMGNKLSPKELDRFMGEADVNKDGLILWEEFVLLLTPPS